MTQHDRLLTMVSELDDQGYTPEQIARAVKNRRHPCSAAAARPSRTTPSSPP